MKIFGAEGAMDLTITHLKVIQFWVQIVELQQFDQKKDTQVGEEAEAGKLHQMYLPILM
jgi:hypothetical protein